MRFEVVDGRGRPSLHKKGPFFGIPCGALVLRSAFADRSVRATGFYCHNWTVIPITAPPGVCEYSLSRYMSL
jgi:hypothetical protein